MPSGIVPTRSRPDVEAPSSPDLAALFHRLNNQLGTSLAHAELIEVKSSDATDRSRAEQVTRAVLEAMLTAQEIRRRLTASGAFD